MRRRAVLYLVRFHESPIWVKDFQNKSQVIRRFMTIRQVAKTLEVDVAQVVEALDFWASEGHGTSFFYPLETRENPGGKPFDYGLTVWFYPLDWWGYLGTGRTWGKSHRSLKIGASFTLELVL